MNKKDLLVETGRVYAPIKYSPGEAYNMLEPDAGEVSGRIARILLDAELTPIQVQAALAAAWGTLQECGRICAPETSQNGKE